MLIAGKVFKLIGPQSLEEFTPRLENYRLQQDYGEGDYWFALKTEVAGLSSAARTNVDTLSLYGPDLMGTTLFEEYSQRGNVWYIVSRAREYRYLVGITRDASVTILNLSTSRNIWDTLRRRFTHLWFGPSRLDRSISFQLCARCQFPRKRDLTGGGFELCFSRLET